MTRYGRTGRTVTRDGVPVLTVTREPTVSPVDTDAYAHAIARLFDKYPAEVEAIMEAYKRS